MTTTTLDIAGPSARGTAPIVAALPLICSNCGSRFDAEPTAICLKCLGPLVPYYDATR